jgi:GxxExxY protein
MTELLLKEESFKIIGLCMEVHRELGPGFQEIVYKDALEFELKEARIAYEREKGFKIHYKKIVLERRFYADFIVYDQMIGDKSYVHACYLLHPTNIELLKSLRLAFRHYYQLRPAVPPI